MDSLIGQLIIVAVAAIIVPEIFRKLMSNGIAVILGLILVVTFASIMGR